MAILISSYLCTATYLKCHFKEAWSKALLYPFYHGKNLWKHLKRSALAIRRGEDLPEEPQREKEYGHGVKFFEAFTESVLQLCVSCLVLREFGLSTVLYESISQLSIIFTSLASIILLFAKVGRLDYYLKILWD